MVDRTEANWPRGCARSSGPRDLDRDFEQELESHLAMLTEDNVRRGMTPGTGAPRGADPGRGHRRPSKSSIARSAGCRLSTAILQDLRFAFRLIAKERWFSAAADRGAGARHRRQRDRLHHRECRVLPGAAVRGRRTGSTCCPGRRAPGCRANVSHAELQDWRAQSRSLRGLAAYRERADEHQRRSRAAGAGAAAPGSRPTRSACSRQQPLLGRDFAPGDERTGAEPVVIIGYSIWKNRYGADPDVLGQVAARERTAGDDHRRHAREHEISRQHRGLGAVHSDGSPGAARTPGRSACSAG